MAFRGARARDDRGDFFVWHAVARGVRARSRSGVRIDQAHGGDFDDASPGHATRTGSIGAPRPARLRGTDERIRRPLVRAGQSLAIARHHYFGPRLAGGPYALLADLSGSNFLAGRNGSLHVAEVGASVGW